MTRQLHLTLQADRLSPALSDRPLNDLHAAVQKQHSDVVFGHDYDLHFGVVVTIDIRGSDELPGESSEPGRPDNPRAEY